MDYMQMEVNRNPFFVIYPSLYRKMNNILGLFLVKAILYAFVISKTA